MEPEDIAGGYDTGEIFPDAWGYREYFSPLFDYDHATKSRSHSGASSTAASVESGSGSRSGRSGRSSINSSNSSRKTSVSDRSNPHVEDHDHITPVGSRSGSLSISRPLSRETSFDSPLSSVSSRWQTTQEVETNNGSDSGSISSSSPVTPAADKMMTDFNWDNEELVNNVLENSLDDNQKTITRLDTITTRKLKDFCKTICEASDETIMRETSHDSILKPENTLSVVDKKQDSIKKVVHRPAPASRNSRTQDSSRKYSKESRDSSRHSSNASRDISPRGSIDHKYSQNRPPTCSNVSKDRKRDPSPCSSDASTASSSSGLFSFLSKLGFQSKQSQDPAPDSLPEMRLETSVLAFTDQPLINKRKVSGQSSRKVSVVSTDGQTSPKMPNSLDLGKKFRSSSTSSASPPTHKHPPIPTIISNTVFTHTSPRSSPITVSTSKSSLPNYSADSTGSICALSPRASAVLVGSSPQRRSTSPSIPTKSSRKLFAEREKYILFKDPKTDEAAMELLNKPNEAYKLFFKRYTCYDLVPSSSKLVVFDTQLSVKKAFFALVYNGVRAAPLWDADSQTYVGMLTITDFIRILHKFYKAPQQRMDELEDQKISTWKELIAQNNQQPFHCIGPEANLLDAVNSLLDTKVHRLPIIDGASGNPLHILTHKRILKHLHLHMKLLPTPNFMSRSLAELELGTYAEDGICKITAQSPIIKALDIFVKSGVSALPVVDEFNKLVDVYAKFDVINLAATKTYENLGTTVFSALEYRRGRYDYSTATCYKTDKLQQVIDKIVEIEVHRLIIVDTDNYVIGIISLSDILAFLVK